MLKSAKFLVLPEDPRQTVFSVFFLEGPSAQASFRCISKDNSGFPKPESCMGSAVILPVVVDRIWGWKRKLLGEKGRYALSTPRLKTASCEELNGRTRLCLES